MTLRRVLSVLVSVTLLSLATATPLHAAEPGYPTGTFTLDKRVGYLHEIDWEDGRWYTVYFPIRVSGLTDDETAPEDLVVEASAGGGSAFYPMTVPCPPLYATGQCAVGYGRPGTFSPQVRVTDEDGNATVIDLPQVSVLRDYTPPVVRVTKPGPRKLHRVSAWRVIRGTVIDSGVGGTFRDDEPDGIHGVSVELLQKRGARWWYYGYGPGVGHHRWFRGLRTEAATFEKVRRLERTGVSDRVDGTRWQTPWIRGLKRGTLVVRVYAEDWNSNPTDYRKYAWVRLTRR